MLLTCFTLFHVSCHHDLDAVQPPDGPRPDGAAIDMAAVDTIAVDGKAADIAPVDQAGADQAVSDGAPMDKAPMDKASVDGTPLDKAVPDKAVPDQAVPDKAVPDKAVPDKAVPDKAVPDQVIKLDAQAPPVLLDPQGIRMTITSGNEQFPTVASHGSGYMTLWDIAGTVIGATMSTKGGGSVSLSFSMTNVSGTMSWPAIAFASANYVAVYEYKTQPTANSRIYVGRLTPAGFQLDTKNKSPGIPISDGTVNQVQPAVACTTKQCLVVWQDYRNSTIPGGKSGYDIYGRRIDPSNGKVLDNADLLIGFAKDSQFIPDVAFDGTDYLVVWQDPRAGVSDAYGARVSTNVATAVRDIGGVPISTTGPAHGYVNVACDGLGGCLVAWMSGTASPRQILGVVTKNTSSGLKVTSASPFLISDKTIGAWFPDVAYNGMGQYLVVWQHANTNANINGVRVTSAGKVQGPSIPLSYGSNHETNPAVTLGSGQLLVTWQDKRFLTQNEIYTARVTP